MGRRFSGFLLLVAFLGVSVNADVYNVGRGIADVTGVAADAALYGYGSPNQDARGIHLREYSRAFVFEKDGSRVAFVVVETCMITQALRTEVIEELEVIFGNMYTYDNVMLTATHSHSSPGGAHTYFMYLVPNGGLIGHTYNILVNGIVQSIVDAHISLRPADIFANSGDLLDASISRSSYSYTFNPEEEKAKYSHDVDKEMTVLKVVDTASQTPLGMVNLFAVHPTNMKNWNHLISGDNKGHAAMLFEKYIEPDTLPGKTDFVAAFSQTQAGDVSPNTQGEWCTYSNMTEMCALNTSTCSQDWENPQLCLGIGPAGEMFEDTRIIGEKQYEKAVELYEAAELDGMLLSGPIDYRHQWVDMSDVVVSVVGNETKRTCLPSMGYSFAAGATDGPGGAPFYQGMTENKFFIDKIIDRFFNHSYELDACQAPKPVLLPTGEIDIPEDHPWQPTIVPVHLMRIGDIVLLGLPHEVTTMSGRRLREAVRQILLLNGYPLSTKTITVSMANGYTSYLTTYEEYQVQRYEAASVVYGQHSLEAWTMKFSDLAQAMGTGMPVLPGTPPPDLRSLVRDNLEPTLEDLDLPGYTYGDVLEDVEFLTYQQGDTVEVVFLSASPRNDYTVNRTFVEVQLRHDVNHWSTVYTDASWETRFYWDSNCHDVRITNSSECNFEQQSNATILWEIPLDQRVGNYRIVHWGNAKLPVTQEVVPFYGISSEFRVQPTTEKTRKPYYVPERYESWREEYYEDRLTSILSLFVY